MKYNEQSPRQIVEELDKYIVGQSQAKRSVAIALRNRWRSRFLAQEFKDEIVPKNILMIGPTGVGKTEIARRLAKLVKAPFIKVEATKFTEVGYVGRDVESMVRDLVEAAIRMVKQDKLELVQEKAKDLAEERILDLLVPLSNSKMKKTENFLMDLFNSDSKDDKEESERGFGNALPEKDGEKEGDAKDKFEKESNAGRRWVAKKLANGEMEDKIVEIKVSQKSPQVLGMFSNAGMDDVNNIQDLLGSIMPKKTKTRKVTVAEARKIFTDEEAQKLIDNDSISSEAIKLTERAGIIFLDEIDKVADKGRHSGPGVSREGVQRDILPIVEGSTVNTKYGQVKTDHILFIAAGAFHMAKPSDLIPELQGRFPIRVELTSLKQEDFKRILTEPANALLKQYKALLATEGIELEFTDDAIDKLAETACIVNEQAENIGARRLHTIMERLLENISFDAPELTDKKVVIDTAYVTERMDGVVQNPDLSKYIL